MTDIYSVSRLSVSMKYHIGYMHGKTLTGTNLTGIFIQNKSKQTNNA